MHIDLSCACGQVTGRIENADPEKASLATCYCTDCQAFSEALGKADTALNDKGGTTIYQTLPSRLKLLSGRDQLKIMRVTEKQAYRWYAGCCDTPLVFTAPTPSVPILGVNVRNFREGAEAAYPPFAGALFKQEAWGEVDEKKASFPKLAFAALARAFGAKLRGEKGPHPLFGPNGEHPEPKLLTQEEREAVDRRLEARKTQAAA
ncbi:DUF6151 family protein [Parvularcula maris]|uniref:DUF6151 family protein n=1 Tax=Parvularcula maris TaxID=2965077 RepID=A0A9X2RIX8_9PROT|nr:DUF6151 family protein [Parvularcula maris]MCQ8184277.1 DUF6151 family protein [Parvularcula maris]